MASPLHQLPLPDRHEPAAPSRSDKSNPPPARWLRLPRADQALSRHLRRWALALPTLLSGHRLRADRTPCYACRFEPPPGWGERFAHLLDLRRADEAPAYPVLYAQGAISLLQRQVLADLGLQQRHVRLLRHRTRGSADAMSALAGVAQDVDCRLARLVRVGPTDVAVLLETHVADVRGGTPVALEDVFLVRGLPVADALRAGEDDLLRRAVGRMRRRERGIDAAGAGVWQRHLYVSHAAARRYDRLAGGEAVLAVPPVLPAMLLRHLVARELAEWGVMPVSLQLTFLATARPGQTLRLLLLGSSFELVDERECLVAFGQA